jgi:hypothetical protein
MDKDCFFRFENTLAGMMWYWNGEEVARVKAVGAQSRQFDVEFGFVCVVLLLVCCDMLAGLWWWSFSLIMSLVLVRILLER